MRRQQVGDQRGSLLRAELVQMRSSASAYGAAKCGVMFLVRETALGAVLHGVGQAQDRP